MDLTDPRFDLQDPCLLIWIVYFPSDKQFNAGPSLWSDRDTPYRKKRRLDRSSELLLQVLSNGVLSLGLRRYTLDRTKYLRHLFIPRHSIFLINSRKL